MNVHKNARLTPSGRVLLVERIERGWPVGDAAAASGVSGRTAYEWLRRYRCGDRQLNDRSSAPHNCPHQLTAEQIAQVERLRRQPGLASPLLTCRLIPGWRSCCVAWR